MVQHLIFDMGGVLLTIDEKKCLKELIKLGLKLKEEDGLFWNPEFKPILAPFERGELSEAGFYKSLRDLGADASDTELRDAWNSLMIEVPKARMDFLDRLHKNFDLVLFSNINSVHLPGYRAIMKAQYGTEDALERRFRKAYFSNLIGMRKPEVETFRWICEDAGIIPERALFIDDGKPNVEGAAKAGLQTRFLDKEQGMEITALLADLV